MARAHSIGSAAVPLLLTACLPNCAMPLPQRLLEQGPARSGFVGSGWEGATPWRTPWPHGLSPAAAIELA